MHLRYENVINDILSPIEKGLKRGKTTMLIYIPFEENDIFLGTRLKINLSYTVNLGNFCLETTVLQGYSIHRWAVTERN